MSFNVKEGSATEGFLGVGSNSFAESSTHIEEGTSMCFEVPKLAGCNLVGSAVLICFARSENFDLVIMK